MEVLMDTDKTLTEKKEKQDIVRKKRLMNEYESIQRMNGSILKSTVKDVNNPCHYELIFHTKTCIGVDASGRPIYRDVSVVDLILPPDYPFSPPVAYMRDQPPAHVNWYKDGQWCYGVWRIDEPLWSYVWRMHKTIEFVPEYTNVNSMANSANLSLWNEGLSKGWFPCDNQNLPTGDKKRSRIRIIN